jgi:hypothetical protein
LLSGNYACIIKVSNTCIDTTSCVSFNVGIKQIYESSQINLIPNPASDFILIPNAFDLNDSYQFKIVSIDGKEISVQHNIQNDNAIIPINTLAIGIYTLQIINQSTGGVYHSKFVKACH